MQSRRTFIQQATLTGLAIGTPGTFSFLIDKSNSFSFQSSYLKVQLHRDYPAFSYFSTDSLGAGQLSLNPILQFKERPENQYKSRIHSESISYFINEGKHFHPLWKCIFRPKYFVIRTKGTEVAASNPFTISFAQRKNHVTVLGIMERENKMKFPCILHLPGMGTFLITCNDPDILLYYDADRDVEDPFVRIALSAADTDHQEITYRFDVVTIYPDLAQIKNDHRYDGFRKNFLNIFQINPRRQALSNNSASDACAFTVFLYGEMARHTPPVAHGITAMDMVRDTLSRYLNGMKGYGQVGYPGWQSEYDSSDSHPSLIIAACYYILDTKDHEWASKNYDGIKAWADKMIATDTNHDCIIEYGYSGNSGSWDIGKFKRPANWWDTIGFGHDDAYSNALAYRACILLAMVAQSLNKSDDSHYFNSFARKLRSNYYPTFYNPETGILAGWKSADGQLHDYYFTFVNSVAISYDLLDEKDAKPIMQVLLNKMKEAGYNNFTLGLPGNLIPIADKDYVDHHPRFGYQHFQVYENGGATGCYVYYTIHALYKLGMRKEANGILFQMLESYKNGGFQGYCKNSNMTKDWKTWKGECWGYEGFLVDSYLALLNVLDQW